MKHEDWCFECLKSEILTEHPQVALRGDRGCEPPDFWLHINGRRFATEVTTILVERDLTSWESLRYFLKKIERNAIEAGILCGRYYVCACAELPKKDRDALSREILAHLHDTRGDDTSIARELRVGGALFGHITKYAPEGARLYLTGSQSDGSGLEVETGKELRQLLNDKISRKRQKLVKCGCPAVLILQDAYYREIVPARFVELVEAAADASFFQAIFLIHCTDAQIFAHGLRSLIA